LYILTCSLWIFCFWLICKCFCIWHYFFPIRHHHSVYLIMFLSGLSFLCSVLLHTQIQGFCSWMVIHTVLKLCIRFLMHGFGVTHVNWFSLLLNFNQINVAVVVYIYGLISMSYCLLGRFIFFLSRLFITNTCKWTGTHRTMSTFMNTHSHAYFTSLCKYMELLVLQCSLLFFGWRISLDPCKSLCIYWKKNSHASTTQVCGWCCDIHTSAIRVWLPPRFT